MVETKGFPTRTRKDVRCQPSRTVKARPWCLSHPGPESSLQAPVPPASTPTRTCHHKAGKTSRTSTRGAQLRAVLRWEKVLIAGASVTWLLISQTAFGSLGV